MSGCACFFLRFVFNVGPVSEWNTMEVRLFTLKVLGSPSDSTQSRPDRSGRLKDLVRSSQPLRHWKNGRSSRRRSTPDAQALEISANRDGSYPDGPDSNAHACGREFAISVRKLLTQKTFSMSQEVPLRGALALCGPAPPVVDCPYEGGS